MPPEEKHFDAPMDEWTRARMAELFKAYVASDDEAAESDTEGAALERKEEAVENADPTDVDPGGDSGAEEDPPVEEGLEEHPTEPCDVAEFLENCRVNAEDAKQIVNAEDEPWCWNENIIEVLMVQRPDGNGAVARQADGRAARLKSEGGDPYSLPDFLPPGTRISRHNQKQTALDGVPRWEGMYPGIVAAGVHPFHTHHETGDNAYQLVKMWVYEMHGKMQAALQANK